MSEMATLITGATGFVGSNLVSELLRRNPRTRVICPARSNQHATARDRILSAVAAAVAAWAKGPLTHDWQDRIQVVEGALDTFTKQLLPQVGSTGASTPIGSLWHCASSTLYESTDEIDLAQINVEGTKHVLDAAGRLGCQEFNYVSTAYVAGCRDGAIAEELPARQGAFNNAYEQTKAEAERAVEAFSAGAGMVYRMFRPSIVIGDSITHKANSGGGLNKVIDSAFKLKDVILKRNPTYFLTKKTFRVNMDPDKAINLIPIDHVIAEMLAISDRTGQSANQIYHITREHQLTVADAMAAFSSVFGIEIECGNDPSELDRAENAFERAIRQFKPYLMSTKTFQRHTEVALDLPLSHAEWRPSTALVEALIQARATRADT